MLTWSRRNPNPNPNHDHVLLTPGTMSASNLPSPNLIKLKISVKLAEVLGTYYGYTYFSSPRYLEPTTGYQLPSTKHSLLITNHSLLVTSHYILRTSYHYSSQARAQLCLDRYDEVRSL